MAAAPWTIARVLDWTRTDFANRGIASPRLDAELLIARALKLRRIELYTRFEQPLTDAELAAVRALVERRRRHEPVAYILGEREFYGRPFTVDPRVLIPRPETEGVVEAALALLPPRPAPGTPPGPGPEPAPATTPAASPAVRVLDLCTGSGAIAVTLAVERPDVSVDAVDLSPGAAEVARANAARHQVSDRVRVLEGSLYEPLAPDARYALIASNPPYIRSAEIAGLMPDVRDHEPRLALDGGAQGDAVLAPLLAGAIARLAPGGHVVVELAHDQGVRALELARQAGFIDPQVRKDLAGLERVLVARAPG